MKITPLSITLPRPYEISTDGKGHERSSGLHLSQIISQIGIRLQWFNPQNGSDLQSHLGIAWENYLAQLLPTTDEFRGSEFDFHIGELCEDGISMSPDAIEYRPDGTTAVHEFKATSKKAGRPVEAHTSYLYQLQSYCRAAGTTTGYLHLLFISGKYQPPFPIFEPYRFEFDLMELYLNWQIILREAKELRNEKSKP